MGNKGRRIADLQKLCDRAASVLGEDEIWRRITLGGSEEGPTSLLYDLEKAAAGEEVRSISVMNDKLGKVLKESLETISDLKALVHALQKTNRFKMKLDGTCNGSTEEINYSLAEKNGVKNFHSLECCAIYLNNL